MITKLALKNFTVFDELEIDFSPKINVIIGANGTGKTHLLKAAYGLCAGSTLLNNKKDVDKEDLEAGITLKMLRIFMPLDEKLGKMHHTGASENGHLKAQLLLPNKEEAYVNTSFHYNSKVLAIQDRLNYEKYQAKPVFIPTKEVLSFMKGFTSLYEKYDLSFDQTYQDICLLLDLPKLRQEKLHEKSTWAMREIENICGGRFIFYGGGKVTFKTGKIEYSANVIAEGFRKAGMLSRLLETGAIQPGESGPLFWDEPESNMHPKLMDLFVKILLELSRNGQQVIIATHGYVLLKWFDLLQDKSQADHVRFHALYRDADSNEIKVESADDYRQINENAISETFSRLYDEDINKAFEDIIRRCC